MLVRNTGYTRPMGDTGIRSILRVAGTIALLIPEGNVRSAAVTARVVGGVPDRPVYAGQALRYVITVSVPRGERVGARLSRVSFPGTRVFLPPDGGNPAGTAEESADTGSPRSALDERSFAVVVVPHTATDEPIAGRAEIELTRTRTPDHARGSGAGRTADPSLLADFFGTRGTTVETVVVPFGGFTVSELPRLPPGTGFFSGLIGVWELEIAAPLPKVHVGETISLALTARGDNPAAELALPAALPDFTLAASQPARVSRMRGKVRLIRRFSLTPLRIPAAPPVVRLTTFDPEAGAYRVRQLALPFRVFPRRRPRSSPGPVIPAMTTFTVFRQPVSVLHSIRKRVAWSLLLSFCGMAAWAASLWAALRRKRGSAGPDSKERLRREIRTLVDQWSARDLRGREQVLRQLRAKLRAGFRAAPGTTWSELADHAEKEFPELAEFLREQEENLARPDGGACHRRRGQAARWSAALLVLPLLIAGEAGNEPREPDGLYRAARRSFRDGDYERVRDLLEPELAKRGADPTVLFNLGSAEYLAGRPGAALACYEKAHRARPRDPTIADARVCVRTRLGLTPGSKRAGRAYRTLRDFFRPDEWMLTAGILILVAGCAAWIPGGQARHRIPRVLAGRAGSPVPILLALLCFAMSADQWRGVYRPRHQAMIIQPVRLGLLPSCEGLPPGPAIRPGTVVTVTDKAPGFTRVDLPPKTGWVPDQAIRSLWP